MLKQPSWKSIGKVTGAAVCTAQPDFPCYPLIQSYHRIRIRQTSLLGRTQRTVCSHFSHEEWGKKTELKRAWLTLWERLSSWCWEEGGYMLYFPARNTGHLVWHIHTLCLLAEIEQDQESKQATAHQLCYLTPCVSTHLVSKAFFYLKLFHISYHLSIQKDCIQ